MSFYALQVSFEKTYYTFAEELAKLFWARLKKMIFTVVGISLENLESREILCVHNLKHLIAPAGPAYKNLREWIQCL